MATKDKIVNLEDLKVLSDHVEGEVTDLKSDLTTKQSLFDNELYGDMGNEIIPTVNGSFYASGLSSGSRYSNRLRTNAISVKTGDKIIIKNGSLKHACGVWRGTISSANIVRNDGTFSSAEETIDVKFDGYYVIVFAKQDDTQDISASDFDGEITQYKSNIYKNKIEIDEIKSTKIDKDGLKQVESSNLSDMNTNILVYKNEHTISTTASYEYEVIYNLYAPFYEGEVYSIGADSVEGASTSEPFVIYLVNSNGGSIRQTDHTATITASDIEAGLYRLAFGLRPATGTPLPTGSATYTGVYALKGTEKEYSLSGGLKKAVESVVGQYSYEIPSYFMEQNYLENKAARINALAENADDVFIFLTDAHWELNAKHSPDLIRYLCEKCNIPRMIDGGDLANGISEEACERYRKAFDQRLYRAVGNHDIFPPTTKKNLYYAFDILNNEQIGNAFNHYYYVENVQQKIRYIVLNTFYHEGDSTLTGWSHYDSEQIQWFSETALNVPNDWDVIVVTHCLYITWYLNGGSSIAAAIDSFNASTSRTGKVLAVFQGHTHWDGVYHTAGGVPIITTTCDKWDLSNETSTIPTEGIAFREQGTIKEQAFDVVILNRAEEKFTLVRIGAPAQDNVDKYRTDTGFTWIGTLQEREVSYAVT